MPPPLRPTERTTPPLWPTERPMPLQAPQLQVPQLHAARRPLGLPSQLVVLSAGP